MWVSQSTACSHVTHALLGVRRDLFVGARRFRRAARSTRVERSEAHCRFSRDGGAGCGAAGGNCSCRPRPPKLQFTLRTQHRSTWRRPTRNSSLSVAPPAIRSAIGTLGWSPGTRRRLMWTMWARLPTPTPCERAPSVACCGLAFQMLFLSRRTSHLLSSTSQVPLLRLALGQYA